MKKKIHIKEEKEKKNEIITFEYCVIMAQIFIYFILFTLCLYYYILYFNYIFNINEKNFILLDGYNKIFEESQDKNLSNFAF
jgi:hypothetical protein